MAELEIRGQEPEDAALGLGLALALLRRDLHTLPTLNEAHRHVAGSNLR